MRKDALGIVDVMLVSVLLAIAATGDVLAKDFVTPPNEARPWVHWFYLSGKDLGILWKPPYRVDITGASWDPADAVIALKVGATAARAGLQEACGDFACVDPQPEFRINPRKPTWRAPGNL